MCAHGSPVSFCPRVFVDRINEFRKSSISSISRWWSHCFHDDGEVMVDDVVIDEMMIDKMVDESK